MPFFSAIFISLEFYAISIKSRYAYDFIFVMLLLISIYLLRNQIKLHPSHYFLFAIFLLAHDIGMFGAYSLWPLGIEYDHWVHGFFGLVSALMLYRAYRLIGPYKSRFIYLAIITVVLDFSAFHELFEFAGAMALGEGEGVLFIGAGDIDEWDTQKDMFNNVAGGILGLILYVGYLQLQKSLSKTNHKKAKPT